MTIVIRAATQDDVPAMAALRTETWGAAPYWEVRIAGYLRGDHSPQQALAARTAFVAADAKTVVGLVAGHLTKRFGCDGELEWIDVTRKHRGQGIAQLMAAMAGWLVMQDALRVCVNVAPGNTAARRFYAGHGAVQMNEHWMVWSDVGVSAARK